MKLKISFISSIIFFTAFLQPALTKRDSVWVFFFEIVKIFRIVNFFWTSSYTHQWTHNLN